MSPTISFFSEDIDFYLSDSEIISNWLLETANAEQKQIDYLNIIFCSDDFLLKINQEYLQHDYYTDIITFDYSKAEIQGEIFISIDRVGENAVEYQVPFDRELHRVMIHGLLHLYGYGDKTEEDKNTMTGKEDYYLQKLENPKL